ncbi:tRNA (guanosine(46)-N7)-methyltransferase TrmB [Nocardioides nitrophenolicus]|uniref:tRNA (guanosine(46)-N7)-methyltransferase TrmB n=1 Tax=Nocardioides nitrophenolicus TaxID=60489 RepID=UPI0027DC1203|nr:tRNA (guanosine(46)-N7)-methyltransferase TrmB [Nocardioides nitrophenolicus]MBM7518849.1 tRNA (guanine-N7-)-methyltransferase [Nocardioides nitrophenolicus]
MAEQSKGGVRPARPHHKQTEDGRRMREVLTYTRRGSRFTPRQQAAWDAYAERWVIPDEAVDDPDFSWARWFGREAPLVVEIGGGVGEATAALAAARPEANVLALEVWRPGVAEGLGRVAEAGATNVRFSGVDAVWTLEHLIAPGTISELWTFFPDPWHKTRHHKRRLVNPEYAAMIASRLAPGGLWRLATDWADYAEQMVDVLDAEPALEGGVVERWAERPVTKFERKGIAKGRAITDLAYRRVI